MIFLESIAPDDELFGIKKFITNVLNSVHSKARAGPQVCHPIKTSLLKFKHIKCRIVILEVIENIGILELKSTQIKIELFGYMKSRPARCGGNRINLTINRNALLTI